jgi:hypothetical protein
LAAASKLRAVHAASQCLANALRVVFGVIELTTALDRANISVRTQQGESTATVHELHFRKDGAVWRSERPTAVHD